MNLQVRKTRKTDKQAIADEVIASFGDVQGQEIADLITNIEDLTNRIGFNR